MRLIDADALKETIDREIFRHETIDHVFQIIDDAPSIDIVRCKECTERDDDWCMYFGYIINPDDFCSYGEREGE